MHPVLFEIPGIGFPLRSFGLSVLAGFLLAVWLWGKLLARYGTDPKADPERGSQVAFAILIGLILGARLMYVGVEVSRYLGADLTPEMEQYLDAPRAERGTVGARLSLEHPTEIDAAREVVVGHDLLHDPLRILFIWEGGLVMYGGMFGAVLAGLYSSRKHGLHVWNALDTGLVAGFFGQTIGRWGCFFVGDDYGSVVSDRWASLPFPITLRVPDSAWLEAHPESLFSPELAGQTLWATQIWLSANALVIGLVGLWLLRRRRWYGQVGAWILVHYSITRFLIEFFRGDEIRGVWFGGALSTSQLIAIPGVLVGLFCLWHFRGRRDVMTPPATSASSTT